MKCIKKMSLLLVVLTLSLCLVACNSNDVEQTTSTTSTASNTETSSNETDVAQEENAGAEVAASGVCTIPVGELTEADLEDYPVTDESMFLFKETDGGCVVYGCNSTDDIIVIPETIAGLTVVKISEGAFMMKEYRGIVIPDTVKTLETNVFLMCGNLEVIDFGEGLETIATSVVNDCDMLKVVHFPETLTTISLPIIGACKLIEELYIPASVTTIHNMDSRVYSEGNTNEALMIPAGSELEALAIEQGVLYVTY